MIPLIQPETENKLLDALDEVAQRVEDGAHPTDAVYKVAEARRLGRGHVELLARTYNTGRQEAQRRSSDDLAVKTASFPMADAETALARLFPDKVASPRQQWVSTDVSDVYDYPPTERAEREFAERQKAAAAFVWTEQPPAAYPPTPGLQTKKAYEELDAARQRERQADQTLHERYDQFDRALEKLAMHFRLTDAVPWDDFIRHSAFYFGPEAEPVVKETLRRVPLAEKRAYTPTRDFSLERPPYTLLRDCLKQAELCTQAARLQSQAAEKLQQKEAALCPFVLTPEASPALGPVFSEKDASLGSFLGGVMATAAAREISGKLPGQRETQSLVDKTYRQLADPAHETALRNIQTEAALNDLMANDEIISGYDPDEVVGHFNELAQLAPHSANQEGLLRSLLRKKLQQGALDTFDIDTLLKIETNLKNRESLPRQGASDAGTSVYTP